MKKLLVLVLVASFALTGCFGKKETSKTVNGLQVKENNSLMGWLKKGKAVECTLNDENGEMKISTKGDKVKIEGVPYMFASMNGGQIDPGEMPKGTSLTVGDMMYTWSGDKGIKMDIKKMEETASDMAEKAGIEEEPESPGEDWEDQVGAWEAMGLDYDCKEVNLSDNAFTPPSDVTFTDLNEQMDNMQKAADDFLNKMGSGEELDMDALKAEMEKMGGTGIPQ